MVLLECLRGSADSIPAGSIDDIVQDDVNTGLDSTMISLSLEDGEESKMATVTRQKSGSIHSYAINADSEEMRKMRFKRAHEYCRAVIPRRIKDYTRDSSNRYEWHKDKDGNQIWRLRTVGDPSSINIGGMDEDTGTKQYELCCTSRNANQPITAICTNTHWALGDFGIGVGLYYTMLLTWMCLLAGLFLLNAPPMYCNQLFKANLAMYKSCRNLTYDVAVQTFMHSRDADAGECKDLWSEEYLATSMPNICGFEFPNSATDWDFVTLNTSGVDRLGASLNTTGWVTKWDLWIAQQDYEGAGDQLFPRYDYGGSLAPVTTLQGSVQIISVIIMIAFMVSLRRYFYHVAYEFDEKLLSAQDYSVRVSGVLPRDPQAYYDHFNELLSQAGNLGGRGPLMGVPGEHECGVVRVSIVYDNDAIIQALRARIVARRAYTAARLAYEVRDPSKSLDFEMQRKEYLKDSKDGKNPTFGVWLSQRLGCGKAAMYAAHHKLLKAEQNLQKAIQELKSCQKDENGKFQAVYSGPNKIQDDDYDMKNHRRPIFAFVTFQSEDQQVFIKKYYEKGYLIRRKRYADGLQILENYVQSTSEADGWLQHPLPSKAPADVKAARKQLGSDLLNVCSLQEAEEPSDIDWTTQGYLTGKMPLGDQSLDFSGRPGGSNKWSTKFLKSIQAYTVSAIILIVLFGILLLVTDATQRATIGFDNAYVSTAIGYIIAGLITVINILLPNIMKQFVFNLEITTSETEKQTSLVVKLTLVRICNAVLITFLVTPYNDMLSLSLVSKISSLLVLDIVLGPILRLIDLYNLIMRYCIARKARTQTSMNMHFNGTYWNLAERYTDVTKTFFLAIFYAAIAPSGYLLAFGAIFVNYFVDKYLLLRRWRTPPKLDSTISEANRYFQYLAILSHACIALYFYRNWPFECNTIEHDDNFLDLEKREKQLCEIYQNRTMISGGFTRAVGTKELKFYIPVLILMITTILVIFYYFCFKQVAKCCNSLFKCKKKRLEGLHSVSDREKIDEAFTAQEAPDWYYPRISGTIECGRPYQMSDMFISYQLEKDAEARKNGLGGWKWPGQLSEHMAGDHTDHLNGKNLFQSSLMIQHKIFHQNSGNARLVGHNNGSSQPGFGRPIISGAPMAVRVF